MAAGLAGGSSDAAAALLALSRLLAPDVPLGDVIRAGADVGADVPFCVAALARVNPGLGYAEDDEARSVALCEGVGDVLSGAEPETGCALLVTPAVHVSTPVVYSEWDDVSGSADVAGRGLRGYWGNEGDAAPALASFGELRGDDALALASFGELCGGAGNDLAYPAVRRYPLIGAVLGEVVASAPRAGRVFMTGSGPTIAALYADEADARQDYASLLDMYKDRADVDAVIFSRLL
jgi:4-diphosphocytidyl-2-C-methyl-D-erythritol kinase